MKCERCNGIGLLTYDELRREEKAMALEQRSVFQCPDCRGTGDPGWDRPVLPPSRDAHSWARRNKKP